MDVRVIGIDCATKPKKTGISLGKYSEGKIEQVETWKSSNAQSMLTYICDYISNYENVILAMDSPLGWPNKLSSNLLNHNAGDYIHEGADSLFRRETDKFLARKIKKYSLNVGADKIARTALSTLKLINDIERNTKRKISMTWDPSNIGGVNVIEVYPAATLMSYDITEKNYKKDNIEEQNTRYKIINSLKNYIQLSANIELLGKNADALDSVVCLLSAKDFLEGCVYFPENLE